MVCYEVSKELANELNDESIDGFFMGGDMDRMGELDVINNDFKLLISGDANVYEFVSKLSSYRELLDFNFVGNKLIKIKGERWYPLYFGFGNRVFLNDRLYDDLIDYLFNGLNPAVSYGKWNRLIMDE